jgi:hypothetical protein
VRGERLIIGELQPMWVSGTRSRLSCESVRVDDVTKP